MHALKVAHSDLKPDNIFFYLEGEPAKDKAWPYDVILGDFGIATLLEGDDYVSVLKGNTPYYKPPEQFYS